MSGLAALTATVSTLGGQVMDGANRLATVWISAQPGDPDPNSGKPPEWGKAAPAGILIWVFLGVALVFLVKSMNKHMKRVPASFHDDEPAADAAPNIASSDSADTGRGRSTADSAHTDPADPSVAADVDSTAGAAGTADAHAPADVSTE